MYKTTHMLCGLGIDLILVTVSPAPSPSRRSLDSQPKHNC